MKRNLMGFDLMGADRIMFDTPAEDVVTPTHPYMAQLPGDLKTSDVIGKHETFESLANAHIELVGKAESAVYKPGEGASDEVMDQYFKDMGFERIGDPKDLALNIPDGADDDVKSKADGFRDKMKELGIPKAMASSVYDYLVAAEQADGDKFGKEEVARREEAVKELHAEWGDETKTRVENAHRAFEKLAPEGVMKDIKELGLGDEPAWIRFFEKFSNLTEEDGVFLAMRGDSDTRLLTSDGKPSLSFPSMDKK